MPMKAPQEIWTVSSPSGAINLEPDFTGIDEGVIH